MTASFLWYFEPLSLINYKKLTNESQKKKKKTGYTSVFWKPFTFGPTNEILAVFACLKGIKIGE